MKKKEIQTEKPVLVKKRKKWFQVLKNIMKIKYKKTQFIYLGEPFTNGGIILSNHEGTEAPMSLEIWNDAPVRMWGAHEMNSGVVKTYKYQSRVYYHEKKHWNLHLARLFCLIASPLTSMFYCGLNLISTYKDSRLLKTIRESIEALKEGHNIVIYPENSENGYLAELEGFHAGFVVLAETCLKRGMDIPVFITYYKKATNQYIIDAPVNYSQIKEKYVTKEEITKALCSRCNELGKMEFPVEDKKRAKKLQKIKEKEEKNKSKQGK